MTQLTISELFTPMVSGVGGNVNLPPPTGSWLSTLLSVATTVQLPTTAWQPGGPERTLLSIDAVALAQEDAIISIMAQGGFLDFAASGTVTYVALNGKTITQPVTPDPSIQSQNPTGAPGWEDLLASSVYDVTRLSATYVSGPLAIVNTTASPDTFAAGTYHVANTITRATYANVLSVTVPPSLLAGSSGLISGVTPGGSITSITTSAAHGLAPGQTVYIQGVGGISGLNQTFAAIVAIPSPTQFTLALSTSGSYIAGGFVYLCTVTTFQSDVIGTGSNASVGSVTTPITSVQGFGTSNTVAWSGAGWESNVALAARCRLKLAAASPNGPAAAFEYFALTAQSILASQTPAVSLTNGPITAAETYTEPSTGHVITVIASDTPASSTLGAAVTPGCTQLPITAATNATPIAITTSSNHGLSNGNAVTITGVLGNTAANGSWTITVTGLSSFTLNSSAGSGTYTGGGFVDGGDLGQVDALLQAKCVPDSVVAITRSALAFPVSVSATVVVPQAYVTTYRTAVAGELDAYLKAQPLGGNPPPGSTVGTIPISAIEGVLFDVGVIVLGATSFVRQVTNLTINGGIVDLLFPSQDSQSLPGVYTINVVGV